MNGTRRLAARAGHVRRFGVEPFGRDDDVLDRLTLGSVTCDGIPMDQCPESPGINAAAIRGLNYAPLNSSDGHNLSIEHP